MRLVSGWSGGHMTATGGLRETCEWLERWSHDGCWTCLKETCEWLVPAVTSAVCVRGERSEEAQL